MDMRGIFWVDSRSEYRVRVTRDKVTYQIGYSPSYTKALRMRDEFLNKLTDASVENSDMIYKYSARWWQEQADKQREMVKAFKNADDKSKVRHIVIPKAEEFHFSIYDTTSL